MKRLLALLLAALILSGCASLGLAQHTPAGGVLTTTDTTEVYVGPPGSAWNFQLRYVLDDDSTAPQGPWDRETAPLARVRITIPKPIQ